MGCGLNRVGESRDPCTANAVLRKYMRTQTHSSITHPRGAPGYCVYQPSLLTRVVSQPRQRPHPGRQAGCYSCVIACSRLLLILH